MTILELPWQDIANAYTIGHTGQARRLFRRNILIPLAKTSKSAEKMLAPALRQRVSVCPTCSRRSMSRLMCCSRCGEIFCCSACQEESLWWHGPSCNGCDADGWLFD